MCNRLTRGCGWVEDQNCQLQNCAGELLETDNLELDINEDTLAILTVAQMQMRKGLTAEDLIKRLLTEPT